MGRTGQDRAGQGRAGRPHQMLGVLLPGSAVESPLYLFPSTSLGGQGGCPHFTGKKQDIEESKVEQLLSEGGRIQT